MTEISYAIGMMQLTLDYFHYHNKNLTKKQYEKITDLECVLDILKRTQEKISKEMERNA